MTDVWELLLPYLPTVRIPTSGTRIYKDECAFSFDSPESEGGLYVCMNTFLGFGREHVEKHYQKTGQCVYMHLKRTRREKPQGACGGGGASDGEDTTLRLLSVTVWGLQWDAWPFIIFLASWPFHQIALTSKKCKGAALKLPCSRRACARNPATALTWGSAPRGQRWGWRWGEEPIVVCGAEGSGHGLALL
ncbi:unnamed protein product [Lampetra fluviatilis]